MKTHQRLVQSTEMFFHTEEGVTRHVHHTTDKVVAIVCLVLGIYSED